MTTAKRSRGRYTEDFKRDAVALVTEQGYKTSEAARSLGINDNLLRKWRQRFEEEAAGVRLNVDEREELKRLRKENRLLRMERVTKGVRATAVPLNTIKKAWTLRFC